MEDLRIPTHSIQVHVHTDQRERLPGALYVLDGISDTGPATQILGLLNDARAFVPFRTAFGPGTEVRDVALNKNHIVRVHLQAWDRPDPESAPPVGRGPYRMDLSDGTSLTGELYVDTPVSSSRLVDKLNQTDRFIPIVTDEGVDLVHRDHVLRME